MLMFIAVIVDIAIMAAPYHCTIAFMTAPYHGWQAPALAGGTQGRMAEVSSAESA